MSKTYLMEKLTGQQGKYAVFNSDGSIGAQTLNAGVVPQIRVTADEALSNVTVNGIQASGSGTEWYYNCQSYGSYIVVATQGSNSYTEIIEVKVVKQYTVDASFLPAKDTLNNTSWTDIKKVSDAGAGSNYWAVGDCKQIHLQGTMGTLSLNTDLYCYILGFDHNWTQEANGNAHGIDFGTFKTTVSGGVDVALVDSYYGSYQLYNGTKYFQMCHWGPSSYGGNYGGWYASDMRYDILGSTNVAPTPYKTAKASGAKGADPTATCTTNPVANTLMACLPSDLRAVMKCMVKYTDNTAGGSNTDSYVTSGKDYLPLLAEKEIFGSRTYANSAEQNKQVQYAYYSSSNSKKKYKHNNTGSVCYWWERSPYYHYSEHFCAVGSYSDANYSNASSSIGVAPAFRV